MTFNSLMSSDQCPPDRQPPAALPQGLAPFLLPHKMAETSPSHLPIHLLTWDITPYSHFLSSGRICCPLKQGHGRAHEEPCDNMASLTVTQPTAAATCMRRKEPQGFFAMAAEGGMGLSHWVNQKASSVLISHNCDCQD